MSLRSENLAESGKRFDDALAFLRILWSLDHALRSASKRMGQAIGVTGPQRFALRMLGRFSSLSAAELADLLELDPSTLTGVLARLGEAGLIERRAADDDGRRLVLTLSKKGRLLDKDDPGTIEAGVRRVLESVDAEDLEATERVLAALTEQLGKVER